MTRLIQSNLLRSGEKCVHSASPLERQTDHLHHNPVGNLSVTELLFLQVLTHLLGLLLNEAMSIALQQRILCSCPWRTAMLLWKLAYGRTGKHSYSSLLGLGFQKFIFLHVIRGGNYVGKEWDYCRKSAAEVWTKPRFPGVGASHLNPVCFCQRWQSGGPGSAGHLKPSALPQAKEADICQISDHKEKTEHFPFPVLLHIGYRLSHLGVDRRHDFEGQD